MNIIIFGDSITASNIAQSLISDTHEITLVGQNQSHIKHIEDTLNIQTVCGSYSAIETYEAAECHLADMVIVMTQNIELDLMITLITTSLYATPKVISTLPQALYEHKDKLLPMKKSIPSEHIWINTEKLAADYLSNLTNHPGCQEILILEKKHCIARVKITQKDNTCTRKSLKAMSDTQNDVSDIATIRDHKVLAQHKAKINDQIIFSCPLTKLDTLLSKINRTKSANNIIIAGLTPISQALTTSLMTKKSVKIIEKNISKARNFAQENENITILEGDINDHALMIAENIDHTDAFLALSDDDEDNLVAALQAKRHGVPIVAALVNRTEITPIIEDHAIHSIEPQKILTDHIFQIIHEDLIFKQHTLHENAGIVLTCIIPAQCNQLTLQKLALPTCVIPCLLYRQEDYVALKNNTQLHTGDHLTLLIPEKDTIHKVLQRLKQPTSLLDLFSLG